MIISFAWTIEPLLAGLKTCTRRAWCDAYFQQWVRAWREGRHVHQAWDALPFRGGCHRADINLTCEPYRERLADMPESDLVAEGGLWASKEEFIALFSGDSDKRVAVVRFELVRYCQLCGEEAPILRTLHVDGKRYQACELCWSEMA